MSSRRMVLIAVAVKGLLIMRREIFVLCALMRDAVSWAKLRAFTSLIFELSCRSAAGTVVCN